MEKQFAEQKATSFVDRIDACLANLDSICRSLRSIQLTNIHFVKKTNELLSEIVFLSSDGGIPSVPSLLAVAENNRAELLLNKAKLNVYQTVLETLDDLRKTTLRSAVEAGETDQLRYHLSTSFQRLLEALSTLRQQSNQELALQARMRNWNIGSASTTARKPIAIDGTHLRQSYIYLLQSLSEDLFTRLPSEINDDEIYALEALLNEMYCRSYRESWASDIQETILSALSQIGALCFEMKQTTGKKRDSRAIKTIKQFAYLFQLLSFYIAQDSSKQEKVNNNASSILLANAISIDLQCCWL